MDRSPGYSPLTEGERSWLDAHVRYAEELGLAPTDVREISDFFDSSLRAVRSGEQAPEDANAVINIVGVLLGEYICSTTSLDWAIMTDEFGTDLCVHDPATSWVFFPQSSTAKRWEAGETDWVEPFVAWVRDQVQGPPS